MSCFVYLRKVTDYYQLEKNFVDTLLYLNGNLGESLLAIGEQESLTFLEKGDWSELDKFLNDNKGRYIFGALAYDLKNEFERLHSSNPSMVDFPLLYFFVPEYVIEIKGESTNYLHGAKSDAVDSICRDFLIAINTPTDSKEIVLQSSISKKEYTEKVERLLEHIQQGDIYEVTFCQEFSGKAEINSPEAVYGALNSRTTAPFSCFFKRGEHYLLSGTPERFMKKEGRKITSQPIKGTAARSSNTVEDELLKEELKNSQKERSENVMIVDLVRNDLSKIAKQNTVNVDELFGIYSFKTVHQMISTISAELKENISFSEILRAMFPMGSMTGAPKIRAMELIEEFENFKRGMFSGSIGYIKPTGDFDFNVIIRSILYDDSKKLISCPVGSAITIQSDPELEYQECLLKVNAMLSVLNGQ
jgi:para-aminobenzoate synthetase component 1